MPNGALQVVIWPTSNLQADAAMNTWSCEYLDLAGFNKFADAVEDFYQALPAWYSGLVRQNNHTMKGYNRADPQPRAPVLERTWSFPSAPAGNALPQEVAKCVSFQGAPESGVSQARRRGRVYIGPLDVACLATDGRPINTFLAALGTAATALLAASDAATDWIWTVFSSSTGDSSPITNGWIDNAWDTQRSRGITATARQTFT